ncbi:hypothetical protein [Microbulbifer sp. SSSA005]|uniref:hypothetical protein n=1 Tax=Microbulbifer sp. SSSA005 TaxID=3243378 RepID=UPI0040398BDC
MDINWIMRCLNESIAHQANIEDHCTGISWQDHFKSKALLDERALATCMVYVDLNPIRADIEKTSLDSDHISIQQRIRSATSGEQSKGLFGQSYVIFKPKVYFFSISLRPSQTRRNGR